MLDETLHDDENSVLIRTPQRDYPIQATQDLPRLAVKWAEVLRNPQAWNRAASTRFDITQGSRDDLAMLGLNDNHLREIASAGLVEVRIPDVVGGLHAAVTLPWEFLLWSATERLRTQPILVIRHLACDSKDSINYIPERLTVVKSSPGFLSEIYLEDTFSIEEENVAANLQLTASPNVWNPTKQELAELLAEHGPDVIHMAGVDIRQARELADDYESTIEEQESLKTCEADGMVFRDEDNLPRGLGGVELAEALCGDCDPPPILVAYNFYNTAPLAAAVVSRGAHFGLGCQGDLDDVLAEIFYCNFYLAWRLGKWKVLDAFRLATAELREAVRADPAVAQRLRGADVVFWSRLSLLDGEKRERFRRKSSSLIVPPQQLREEFEKTRTRPAEYDKDTKPIAVELLPRKELNFALLHNNRGLFHNFLIRKIPPMGQLKNIAVETVLFAGDEKFSYNAHKDLKHTLWVLDEEIRVPLTSKFARSVRETMSASLLVKVSVAGLTMFEQTFRVALLPIDQWQDDERNRKWLPSFVMPRDPGVLKVVHSAQKYLLALADSSTSGFDGYQTTSDEGVIPQVRALWYAMSYERPIRYINPPPTFADEAQRLRTPSDVLTGGRGTCIDLALVLASCMEYIDIYPVVFLLEGHAFPGYYTSENTHREIREWLSRNAGPREEDSWMLGGEFYSNLLDLVTKGEIVPLETTVLTKRGGFWEAVEEGLLNLSNRNEFQFLVDIKLARENGVTPLPLWDAS
jgi:hypothetical protein